MLPFERKASRFYGESATVVNGRISCFARLISGRNSTTASARRSAFRLNQTQLSIAHQYVANRANRIVALVLDPCHDFVQRNAIGTKTIRHRSAILISEGDPANDQTVVVETKMLANEFRMRSQRRLRNRSDAQALRREQKIIHVGAAIHRAIRSERLSDVTMATCGAPNSL